MSYMIVTTDATDNLCI